MLSLSMDCSFLRYALDWRNGSEANPPHRKRVVNNLKLLEVTLDDIGGGEPRSRQ